MATCTAGAFGMCNARIPSAETCNNVDDNCNGNTDCNPYSNGNRHSNGHASSYSYAKTHSNP